MLTLLFGMVRFSVLATPASTTAVLGHFLAVQPMIAGAAAAGQARLQLA